MPVRIGNSYVSEAAYSFASAQVADDEGNSDILNELRSKFSGLKISVGTSPFSGTGTNNVSISPKILNEMQNDPAKKLEYEALLYDVASQNFSRPGLKAHGFIITDDGGLRGWGISQSDNRKSTPLNKNDKKSWWVELLDSLNEKAKAKKDEVQISDKALELNNSEQANGKVGFNANKRARQLNAAQTRDEVQEILNLLQNDLEDCKEGVERGMCDDEEVRKVEDMIERAKQRLNEVDDVETPAQNFSPVDVII